MSEDGTLTINSDIVKRIKFSGDFSVEAEGSIQLLSKKFMIIESGWYNSNSKYKIHLNPCSYDNNGNRFRLLLNNIIENDKNDTNQLDLFDYKEV